MGDDDVDGLHVKIELVVGFKNIKDTNLGIIALVSLPLSQIENYHYHSLYWNGAIITR